MATHDLWTEDANEADHHVTVRLFDPRPRYFHGGLHREAEMVRQGGEMGDDVLLHVTPDEFDQLREAWGEPTINSNTGMPEYGLSRLFKKAGKFTKRLLKNPIVSTLAPIAMNFLLPGVGGLIGQALFGAASSKAQGGNPMFGALTGAAGHMIGGGGYKGTGADASGTLSELLKKGSESTGTLGKVLSKVNEPAQGALSKMSSPLGRIASGLALSGLRSGQADYDTSMDQLNREQPTTGAGEGGGSFGDSLRQLTLSRQRRSPSDYYRYGRDSGEEDFFGPTSFVDNAAPGGGSSVGLGNGFTDYQPDLMESMSPGDRQQLINSIMRGTAFADGGGVRGPGSGRSDDIEALLSDGEYVVDAESVALLGDGSVDEGARRLDQMRENLRRHKGAKLAKGEFSEAAKAPEEYVGGGSVKKRRRKSRSLRKAEGGQAKAIQRMTTLAEQFHQALGEGDRARVAQIAATLDGMHPEASKEAIGAFAKGGSVAEVVKKLLSGRQGGDRRVVPRPEAPERRAIDLYPNERQNLDEIADLLRVLKPESNALRQFESDKARRSKSVKDIEE